MNPPEKMAEEPPAPKEAVIETDLSTPEVPMDLEEAQETVARLTEEFQKKSEDDTEEFLMNMNEQMAHIQKEYAAPLTPDEKQAGDAIAAQIKEKQEVFLAEIKKPELTPRAAAMEARVDAALAAEDRIIGYGDPRMKEAIRSLGDQPYAYGGPEASATVLGVRHSNNPESAMIKEITRMCDGYLATTPKEQAMIMIEGVYNPDDLTPEGIDRFLKDVPDEKDAIKKFGEKGAMLWKARENGTEVTSPEKPQKEIVTNLKEQGFTPEDVSLYLTIRQFTSELGQPHPDSTPEKSLIEFARIFNDIDALSGAGWISTETKSRVETAVKDRNFAALNELAPKILDEFSDGANAAFGALKGMEGKKLIPSREALLSRNVGVADADKVPIDAVNALHDPRGETGITNKVSAAWNTERDKHIVQQISTAQARGKKPLVVYGASHAIAIEPALA